MDVQKRQSPKFNFAPVTPNSVAVALTQYTVATAVALSAAAIPNKIADVTAAIMLPSIGNLDCDAREDILS